MSFANRYALCAMLGITSDEDVDANINGIVQTQSKPTPSKQETSSKQPAKFAFEPKGGETTPAEKKEIGGLLASKYTNGAPVFSKDEAKKYSAMRKDYTAREVIDAIKKELQTRLNPTQAMQTAGDIMRAQAQQPGFDEMQPVGEPTGEIF